VCVWVCVCVRKSACSIKIFFFIILIMNYVIRCMFGAYERGVHPVHRSGARESLNGPIALAIAVLFCFFFFFEGVIFNSNPQL
jgi:F0F1-type ATP synthase membrane subunit a